MDNAMNAGIVAKQFFDLGQKRCVARIGDVMGIARLLNSSNLTI
jgi:hypothetical protein